MITKAAQKKKPIKLKSIIENEMSKVQKINMATVHNMILKEISGGIFCNNDLFFCSDDN